MCRLVLDEISELWATSDCASRTQNDWNMDESIWPKDLLHVVHHVLKVQNDLVYTRWYRKVVPAIFNPDSIQIQPGQQGTHMCTCAPTLLMVTRLKNCLMGGSIKLLHN